MKKRTSSSQVILPGGDAWELWRVEPGARAGSAYSLVSRFDGDLPGYSGDTGPREYGIPASDLEVVPLWIQVPESDTAAAVEMQLEGRGVGPAQTGDRWREWRIARSEGGRRLAVVTALGGGGLVLGEKSALPDRIRSAAEYLPFRNDRVTLYRELGRLVAAVTQGNEIVFQMPLVAQDAGEGAGREIVQTIFQLQFDGVAGGVDGIDLWVEGADVDALGKRSGLAVDVVKRPGPLVPARPAGRLETPDVVRRREEERASAKVRKIAVMAGAVLSLAVAAIVAANVLLGWKRDALLEEIAELTPRASAVADDEGRWLEISSAVDRDRFALELLHRLSEVPSVRGVTLTRFEMAPGEITVAGRASQPGAALKFGGDVTGGAFLPEYRWEFPPPEIAGDNSATFELKGRKGNHDET